MPSSSFFLRVWPRHLFFLILILSPSDLLSSLSLSSFLSFSIFFVQKRKTLSCQSGLPKSSVFSFITGMRSCKRRPFKSIFPITLVHAPSSSINTFLAQRGVNLALSTSTSAPSFLTIGLLTHNFGLGLTESK